MFKMGLGGQREQCYSHQLNQTGWTNNTRIIYGDGYIDIYIAHECNISVGCEV